MDKIVTVCPKCKQIIELEEEKQTVYCPDCEFQGRPYPFSFVPARIPIEKALKLYKRKIGYHLEYGRKMGEKKIEEDDEVLAALKEEYGAFNPFCARWMDTDKQIRWCSRCEIEEMCTNHQDYDLRLEKILKLEEELLGHHTSVSD